MNLHQTGQGTSPQVVVRDPTSRQQRKPSRSTLVALLDVKRTTDLDGPIERLWRDTCDAYAKYGVGAELYEQAFDDLHCCRMLRMALYFRAVRGLPPDAQTPYDDADLQGWLDEVRSAPQDPNEVLA